MINWLHFLASYDVDFNRRFAAKVEHAKYIRIKKNIARNDFQLVNDLESYMRNVFTPPRSLSNIYGH